MLRNPINRSPEVADVATASTETTTTTTATPVSRGFEALSESGIIEATANEQATTTAAVTETTTDGATTTTTDGAPAGEASATTTDTKKEDEEPATPVITEFKVPGVNDATTTTESEEETARKQALADLEKDSSWTALAKVRGLEITEDSFEAYDKAINEDFQKRELTLKETAKAEAKTELLAEKPAEVMAIIEGLEAGYSIEELLEPRRAIQALQSLSNAELIAEDRRLLGWGQELIDKEIAHLTEKDLLDVTAQPLRDILKHNEDTLAQKQVEQLATLKASKATAELQVRQKESDEIKNTIVSMKEYMGVPITDNVVNHIKQKWDKGEYQAAFTDPKVVAEFLMYNEFGEQGLKALKQREYDRGRDDKARKLHNVPPAQSAGGKSNTQGSVKAEGNFGALKSA
jgi:hypothetical protein